MYSTILQGQALQNSGGGIWKESGFFAPLSSLFLYYPKLFYILAVVYAVVSSAVVELKSDSNGACVNTTECASCNNLRIFTVA
jgi:hypothetical protein